MKTAAQIVHTPEFFQSIGQEAVRLDRSMSWLIGKCIEACLSELAALDDSSVDTLQTSPLRDPIVMASFSANLELAENEETRELAEFPPSIEQRTLYFPSDVLDQLNDHADRLGLTSGEVLQWAFEVHGDVVRTLPDA